MHVLRILESIPGVKHCVLYSLNNLRTADIEQTHYNCHRPRVKLTINAYHFRLKNYRHSACVRQVDNMVNLWTVLESL